MTIAEQARELVHKSDSKLLHERQQGIFRHILAQAQEGYTLLRIAMIPIDHKYEKELLEFFRSEGLACVIVPGEDENFDTLELTW